jgi:hypothetical protein
MRFRYSTKTVTTVFRDDVSQALVERVLHRLVFSGSPCLIPPEFPRYIDSARFTLSDADDDGKRGLHMEWDTVDMDYAEPPLPENENKEVKELIQIFGVEKAHVLVIPLTDEDMNTWVELHLVKDLAEYEAAKVRTLEVEGV